MNLFKKSSMKMYVENIRKAEKIDMKVNGISLGQKYHLVCDVKNKDKEWLSEDLYLDTADLQCIKKNGFFVA